MRIPGLALLAGMLVTSACEKIPDYTVPEQRITPDVADAPPAARVIPMDDPGVMARVVRDISPILSGSWRWGMQKPAVKIRVRFQQRLKYTIDFALPEITFKDTGPVTIVFTVNDHVLDRVRYTTPGDHHFEKDVPPDWIQVGEEAIIGAEIDKMWVSKDDGAKFGFIIVRMGLAK